MPIRLSLAIICAFAFAGMAAAGTRTTETWQATWPGSKCTIVLKYDESRLQGPARPRGNCGKEMRKVKSFVYTDETKTHMVLFTRKGAKGPMLGAFDRTSENSMSGMIGDGEPTEMFKSSSSSVTVDLGGTTGGTTGDDGADCVRYANNRNCAIAQDLKDPKIPAFQTITVRILDDQPTYPFSGGRGIATDEPVARGTCRQIKKCEKAFNSNEHWCEIVKSDGFFTAWVKRQDDDWVYLRKGC